MKEETQHASGRKDLVVVGSSAGGVGALSTLVSTLRKDFPAPIVLAQHLDPQRPSNLGTILERRSTLPIVVVDETQPTPLESGKIYVIPANRHVKILDHHVHLEADHEQRPRPSVDMLLTSAAEVFGEHLIAVILTGSGSDGAAGAVEVKNAGGVVIIQNPATAAYPSMPLSLPPTAVDHVVEIEQIGPLLHDLLTGISLPPHEKVEDPLHDLLSQVSRHTKIDFGNYKSTTILRRISRRMAVTHNSSIRDYVQFVQSQPEEIKELVKTFLIKVTGFFRDPEAFEFLKSSILPELIEQARENGRVLRFWSAGCATGEEAYSMALLMADLLGSELPEWSLKIFATDLDEDAVNFARRGLYPANVLTDLPDSFRERFFERVDHGHRIIKSLRQLVIFGHQDLTRGVPFPRIHLVICRNLLIYLNPELQQDCLDLFAYSLHQLNGYLFLGKAETARPTQASFQLVNKKWKIYHCINAPLALPVSNYERSKLQQRSEVNRRQPGRLELAIPARSMTAAESEINQLRRINETILRCSTEGIVIIDRAYRILTVNATARSLLGIRDIPYDQDFLHSVRGLPYQPARDAIDMAFREHTTTSLNEVALNSSTVGTARYLNMTIMLMQVEPAVPELAVISVTDMTEVVQTRKHLEAVQHEQSQLVAELSAANKRFGDINKELQDANEKLQSANEELMLTQEELQATNEEFEATNEELQATNEELETNNEELQATNEELQTTNDELTARTHELQELSKHRQIEQAQLSHLLERFPDYVMVLRTSDLTIQAINPGYNRLLKDKKIIGLRFDEVFAGADLEEFEKIVLTAAQGGDSAVTRAMRMTVGAADIAEKPGSFVHTVVPILGADGQVERIFIYSEEFPQVKEAHAERAS